MKFYILASGSKGNAILVHDNQTTILLDFGVNKSRMIGLLKDTPFTLDDIDFVLFTHEHSDHILGKDFLPIEKRYGSPRAFDVLPDHALAHGDIVQCHDITITVFPLSHDAKDPLGFIFDDGKHSLVYITDTGYISEKNMKLCYDKTYYLLESNHNVKMLLQTDRSQDLKVRILGDSGHLSNEDSAYYFSKMMGPSTKAVYLGHLSDEANTHDVALETYHRVLQKLRIKHDHIKIIATKQWDVLSTIDD
jgi:phosphoribosyl 1,2-cyclic phosphodiesterase